MMRFIEPDVLLVTTEQCGNAVTGFEYPGVFP